MVNYLIYLSLANLSLRSRKDIMDFLNNARSQIVSFAESSINFVKSNIVDKVVTAFDCGGKILKNIPNFVNLIRETRDKVNKLKIASNYAKAKFATAALCEIEDMKLVFKELAEAARQTTPKKKYYFIGRGAGFLVKVLRKVEA